VHHTIEREREGERERERGRGREGERGMEWHMMECAYDDLG
jgi:hypothetical protein